ncbi:MAG: type I restriction endonuclease [Desulfurococcaceae archaeon]
MSSLDNLIETVKKLRERIDKYRNLLEKNEMLTRYVLIDPLLRALGWDTENPEHVRPEERQEAGVPDYVLYVGEEKIIAIEAKSLGTSLDEKQIIELGFKYGWQNKIPYFIITNGDRWDIYDLREPGGKRVASASISKEDPGGVVLKLLPLWRSLLASQKKIEPVKPLVEEVKERPPVAEEKKPAPRVLDLEKAKKFYDCLTDSGRVLIEITHKAWKEGRTLSKDEVVEEMKKRGIEVDRRGFTGVKSGITRCAEKYGLPPPLPSEKELGEEYRDESKRYRLRDEWGRVLEKILATK